MTGLDSVRYIRDYFAQRAIDLGEFEPDHALAEDADGHKDAQSPRLMRRGRDEFLIYHPNAAADEQAAQTNSSATARLRIDLRASAGTLALEWYRAEDGHSPPGADVPAGGLRELIAPWPGAEHGRKVEFGVRVLPLEPPDHSWRGSGHVETAPRTC